MDELADMKGQRHSISYTIDALNKDVEKYSFEAEDKEDLNISGLQKLRTRSGAGAYRAPRLY